MTTVWQQLEKNEKLIFLVIFEYLLRIRQKFWKVLLFGGKVADYKMQVARVYVFKKKKDGSDESDPLPFKIKPMAYIFIR